MNFLDIVKAVHKNTGLDVELNEDSKKITSYFKNSKKTVFILVDGLGYILLNNIMPGSFMANNIKEIPNAIMPSTTATVLTALASGEMPATHAVNGWFNYLEETDSSVISLPFIDRFTGEVPKNARFTDLFFINTKMQDMPIRASMITNSNIFETEYSVWSRGGTAGYGYSSIENAFEILEELLEKDNDPEYIYVYFDEFDTAAHKFGTNSREAAEIALRVNKCVEDYAKKFSEKVHTIITTDHGQVNIKNENFFTIDNSDEMMNFLRAPISGDSRFNCFHVKPGQEDAFKEFFNNKYGAYARLISQKELDESHLLGKENMCEMAKKRFGDFCAIWDKEHACIYVKEGFDRKSLKIGCHSGDSDEETKIPLIMF